MNPSDVAWYRLIVDCLESRATPEAMERCGKDSVDNFAHDDSALLRYAHTLASTLGFYEARAALRYDLHGYPFSSTRFGEWGRAAYISVIAHRHLAEGVCTPPPDDTAIYMAAFQRLNEDDETEYYCLDTQEWEHSDDCVFARNGVAYSQDNDVVTYCEHCGHYEEDVCTLVDHRGDETGEFVCHHCLGRSVYQRVEHPRIPSACAHEDNILRVEGDAYIQRLVEDSTGYCESCSETFWIDNMNCTNGGCYCNSCNESNRSNKIKSRHNSDPTGLGWFSDGSRRMSRTTRYYGFELEVEPRKGKNIHDIADEDLSLIEDWTTLEEDGSLDDGCEIISAPHTLAKMRERFQGPESLETWNKALRRCRSHDTTTCGLHVHVSRVGLPSDMGERLQLFMDKLGNGRFLDVIAQRKQNDYCMRIVSETQRFCAVNLTNEETIEFRLFKGNTRADRVLKAIEFCDALLAYLGQDTFSYTWQGFVEWLSHRVTKYPVLCSYLMERGIQLPEGYEVATQPSLPGLDEAIQADPGLAALLAVNYPVVDLDPVHAP